MRRARLRGSLRGRRMRTTSRMALQQAAPELVERNFVSEQPNRLWVADITYVRSGEGFLYLSFILDACSRKVVGWSMATHLRTELVVDAVQMAIARSKPSPGLVHHSDRGCSTPLFVLQQAAGGRRSPPVDGPGGLSLRQCPCGELRRHLEDGTPLPRNTWPTRQAVRTAFLQSTSRASTTPEGGTLL
jgi:Integrase core domain